MMAICTDNMAFHDVRLPREHELLLLNRALSFADMERCRQAAFRHAFRWPHPARLKRICSPPDGSERRFAEEGFKKIEIA